MSATTFPTEFTSVLQLAGNLYAPIHFKSDGTDSFIADKVTCDLKTAQAAAEIFANAQGISYENAIRYLSTQLIIVLKIESIWYPAIISSDDIEAISFFPESPNTNPIPVMSSSQAEVVEHAKKIAKSRSLPFCPNFVKE